MKIASFEPKSPAELLQILAAPRALLFASTLRGPAARLPVPNKTPRARYSAQSVSKASPCSLTESESQMRGINEHRPPVSVLTSVGREGSRVRGGRASAAASAMLQAPPWDSGGELTQTNQLGPMLWVCLCVRRGGQCPWGGQRWPCHLPVAGTEPQVLPGPACSARSPATELGAPPGPSAQPPSSLLHLASCGTTAGGCSHPKCRVSSSQDPWTCVQAAGLSSALHGAAEIRARTWLTGSRAAAPAGTLGSGGCNGEEWFLCLCITTLSKDALASTVLELFISSEVQRISGSLPSSSLWEMGQAA